MIPRMSYELMKWLHALSGTLLLGGGFGSAFHLVLASARRNPAEAAAAARKILRFDAAVGAPAAVFQIAGGAWLLGRLDLPWTTDWVLWSTVFYAGVIALWIPVIVLEVRMRRIAAEAARAAAPLPHSYWASFFAWMVLGMAGFALFAAILWLMLVKRLPVAA